MTGGRSRVLVGSLAAGMLAAGLSAVAPVGVGVAAAVPGVVGSAPISPAVEVAIPRAAPVGSVGAVATGRVSVRLPVPARLSVLPAAGRMTRAGASPVLLGGVADGAGRAIGAPVGVRVLSRPEVKALGGDAVGVRLALPVGARSAQVGVDYTGFASGYGGFYAARLALWMVPDCAVSAPSAPDCQLVPLKGATDFRAGRITATVPVPTTAARVGAGVGPAVTVIALAAANGSAGDYTSTSLAPSQRWSVGVGSGSFSWSYPVPVPASVGGSAPALSVGYDSGSVDGRTTAANGQTSWIGQGFDLSTGFVERKFQSCARDNADSGAPLVPGGDLCWSSRISYVLSLNGGSHELIAVPGVANEFRSRDDSGWLIRKLTQSPVVNDDDDGEYWLVTTPDGTDYYFGSGQTPWTAAVATKSVLRVPVFGNDTEPCATSQGSVCLQAYRWQLDRVVDTHSNATAYLYERDQNSYKRGNTTTAGYDRDGSLARVEYGAHLAGALPAGSTDPRSFVDFRSVERCTEQDDVDYVVPMPACTSGPGQLGGSYPDVPNDLVCSAACTKTSPSFFSTRRLARIETSVMSAGGAVLPVDWVDFKAVLADPDGVGVNSEPELRLSKIVRTGKSQSIAGSGADMPPVTFGYLATASRVDLAGGQPSLPKFRLASVTNELGGRLTVNYRTNPGTSPACDQAYMDGPPAGPDDEFA